MKQIQFLFSCFALVAFVVPTAMFFSPQRAGAAPNATCTLSWELVPGPSFPGKSPILQIVAHSASNDLWAVGFLNEGTLAHPLYHPLILHWNGSAWSRVAAPDLGTYLYGLLGVTAISPTDAWTVGNYRDGADRGVILHWDGAEWSSVPFPNDWGTILYDTNHAAANHVWAVGARESNPVLLFWDGQEWSDRATELDALGFSELNKVDARGIDDVYVAGRLTDDNVAYIGIAHWNGIGWSITARTQANDSDAPGADRRDYISSMQVLAPDDLWLSLNNHGSSHIIPSYRILRWNGAIWETIEQSMTWTRDMGASAPNLLYALVGHPLSSQVQYSQLEFWNGSTMEQLLLPRPKGPQFPFEAIDVISEQEAWVVGSEYNAPNKHQPYLAHGTSPCAVPARPTHLVPSKNQTIQNANPTLKWEFTPGANSFEVILKQIKTPAIPLQAAVTHSKFKPAYPLIQGATYKWRVRACNNNGCGPWTNPRTFSVAGTGP